MSINSDRHRQNQYVMKNHSRWHEPLQDSWRVLILHCLGQKLTRIAAIADHIAHQRRRNGCMLRRGGQENGLQLRSKAAVHIGNRTLVLKITHVADATQDIPRIDLLTKVDGKPFIHLHRYFRLFDKHLPDPFRALLHRKHSLLGRIGANTDHQAIEQVHGTLNNIHMTKRERIKGTGEKADALVHSSYSLNGLKKENTVVP